MPWWCNHSEATIRLFSLKRAVSGMDSASPSHNAGDKLGLWLCFDVPPTESEHLTSLVKRFFRPTSFDDRLLHIEEVVTWVDTSATQFERRLSVLLVLCFLFLLAMLAQPIFVGGVYTSDDLGWLQLPLRYLYAK